MDELLTVEEVAKMLKMSSFTIREYARRGKLPALKFGQQWRFKKSEVMNWLDSQGGRDKNN